MDVEKTIEFILELSARTEQRFAQNEERFAKIEESFVKAEARAGRPLRSDIRRLQKSQEKDGEKLSEIDGKLDALIDIVDQSIRRNGGRGNQQYEKYGLKSGTKPLCALESVKAAEPRGASTLGIHNSGAGGWVRPQNGKSSWNVIHIQGLPFLESLESWMLLIINMLAI